MFKKFKFKTKNAKHFVYLWSVDVDGGEVGAVTGWSMATLDNFSSSGKTIGESRSVVSATRSGLSVIPGAETGADAFSFPEVSAFLETRIFGPSTFTQYLS